MTATKLWTMKITKEDKAMISRVAQMFRMTESGTVKMLIRSADQSTREKEPAERKPKPNARA
jgi:hypothetical protein